MLFNWNFCDVNLEKLIKSQSSNYVLVNNVSFKKVLNKKHGVMKNKHVTRGKYGKRK